MIKLKNLLVFTSVLLFSLKAFSQGDECINATILSVTSSCNNPVSGTSAGATESFAGCVGNADDDVWYKFTATATSHIITVTPSYYYDPVVELFSGSCSSLTSLYCKDNGFTGDAENIYATGLTVGSTYYIRVYHYYSGSGSNTFTICVTSPPPPPSNDDCNNASTLVVNTSCNYTNGTSYGATSSGIIGCAGSSDDDVWYKFTATNSVQTITVDPSANMDPVVELFSGSCSGLTSLYCQDDGFTNGNEVINAVGLIPGQTYYIRVYDYYNSNGGYPFQICVTGSGTSTPINDECISAIELPEVTSECNYYYFTTIGATNSTTPPTPTNCENFDGSPNAGGFSTSTKDVWFKIKVPSNGKISVRPMPNYGINDAAMALYSGSCYSLTQIACSDDHNYPGSNNDMKPYILATGLTPGSYVYLRYWGYGSTEGDFAICVESPTNDECSSALEICDINGYAGSTSSAYTIDRPGNMQGNAETGPPDYTYTPGTCQPGGIFGLGGPWGAGAPNCDVRIDNNSWIKFTASNPSITLNVSITNCWVGNYPSGGIQMQIFSGNSCSNFTPVSDFKEGSSTLTITANNLVVGQEYYLMIDGFAGDICDYSITANTGVQFSDITASDTSICIGESVTLTAPSGATSYLWSPGGETTQSITVSPVTTFTYSCEVTGVCNFKQTLYKTVVVNPLPDATITPNYPSICTGESITLTASGGTQYVWSTGSNTSSITVSPTTSTTYYVTVTDANGCSNSTSATVDVYPTPNATITPASANICTGESTTLTASGGIFYDWSNGATSSSITVNPTTTTTYTVTVTNIYLCTATANSTVTVNPPPTISVSNNGPICAGNTLQLNASGGVNYVWSGPNNFTSTQQNPTIPNAQVSNQGTYYVTVTGSNGCTATSSVNVVINPTPDVSITTSSPVCVGSTLHIYATQGYSSYNWQGPNNFQSSQSSITIPNVSLAQSGTYTVTVTNSYGCTKVESTIVNVLDFTAGTITLNITQPLCSNSSDGSIEVFITGGTPPYTYQWSHDNTLTSNSAYNLSGGMYSVTITDGNGCNVDTLLQLPAPPELQLTLSSQNPSCYQANNGSIYTTVSGGTPPYNYLWNNNATSDYLTNLGSGTYSLTVTDSHQCTTSLQETLSEPTEIILTLTSTSIQCPGEQNASATVNVNGGTPPYTYLWSNQQATPTIQNIGGGYHSITVTDANLCTKVDSIFINSPDDFTNDAIITRDTINGVASIDNQISGGTPPYQYLWSNGMTSEDLSNIEAGTYILTVTDASNCTFVDTFEIMLPIIIPTLFTPNGDGVNDRFAIRNIHIISKVSIEIYNRWGNKIFTFQGSGTQYSNPENQWDGKVNNKELPMGSFVYIVILNDKDKYNGVVSIVR